MKCLFTIICLVISSHVAMSQERKYSTFYEQRSTLFNLLPTTENDIIFLGNSITNGSEWSELFNDIRIKNRGISGDTSEGVYDRLDPIVSGNPAKIFLMIGINDVSRGTATSTILSNIDKIIEKVQSESPNTKLYLQSILPVNPDFGMFGGHMKPDSIKIINEGLELLAKKQNITFIDIYPYFLSEKGDKLDKELTNDGLHLLGPAYIRWSKLLMPYVKE